MNCLRSSLMRPSRLTMTSLPISQNEKGAATAAPRWPVNVASRTPLPDSRCTKHAVVFAAFSSEYADWRARPARLRVRRTRQRSDAPRGALLPPPVGAVQQRRAQGVRSSGLQQIACLDDALGHLRHALAAVHRQLAQVRKGLLFAEADLAHQDAFGALDDLALATVAPAPSRVARAAPGPARSARSPPAAPAAAAAAADRR